MSKAKGDYGETVVLGYLQSKGHAVLAQNYKKRGGEIDIITQHGEYIVFVEVKYRRAANMGDVALSTSHAQSRRIINTAKAYLYEQDKWYAPCRFDIVEVYGYEQLQINHIENAFEE
ncbi:MAG: YraN family protein [Defluviitaleaceae bacterium]|nr:YraN family protein [Defluviitaleaceae bacterium]